MNGDSGMEMDSIEEKQREKAPILNSFACMQYTLIRALASVILAQSRRCARSQVHGWQPDAGTSSTVRRELVVFDTWLGAVVCGDRINKQNLISCKALRTLRRSITPYLPLVLES